MTMLSALISVSPTRTVFGPVNFASPTNTVPRFSATSDIIDITNRIPDYAVDPLREAGYEVVRSALTFHIAAVHGIRIDNGVLSGGADPGHDGVALHVP